MKTQLGIESLENRLALSAYTVEILDRQNLVSPQLENQMRAAANFTMQNLGRHVNWRGVLDLRIDVQPNAAPHDGSIYAIMSVTPDRRNAVVHEMRTGVDLYPKDPDIGMTVKVGRDGTLKLYGMKLYLDPNPMSYVAADVPAGHADFIGVLNHEVAHGLAFQWGTTEFSRYGTTVGGYSYFNGPETVRTLGRPLPMSTFGGTHYGNHLLPDNPFTSGLMYQWGNYAGNRFDWGRLDLAVLRDVGLSTKNESRLPLVDTMDSTLPEAVLSRYEVRENSSIGTTVATVSMSNGVSGYTFQIVEGWGDNLFGFEGDRLVVKGGIDYETSSMHKVYVRMIDPSGVWTQSPVYIRVLDVQETPVLKTPAWFTTVNGTGPLTGMSISGDSGTFAVVAIMSRSGTFESRATDPEVKVRVVGDGVGGTTVFMTGSIQAISRNFRNILYRGREASITVQMASGGKLLADVKVPLKHLFSGIAVR